MEKEVVSKLGKSEVRSIKKSLSGNAFLCRESSEVLVHAVVRIVNTFFDNDRYDADELVKDAHNQAEAALTDTPQNVFLSDERNVIIASKISSALTSVIEDFGSVFFNPEDRDE